MARDARAQPRIDELSRVIGSLEQQYLNMERQVVALGNSVHLGNDLATADRTEIKKELAAINQKLEPAVEAVRVMQPIVTDYNENKNRAIGFVIALSIFAGLIGAAVKTGVDMFWFKK